MIKKGEEIPKDILTYMLSSKEFNSVMIVVNGETILH